MLIMMMIQAIIMIIMTITTIMTLMMMTIFCRPASYGSWQAVIASKVEGPSKEPGPFLYSGGKLFMRIMMMSKGDDDDDDNDDYV